MRYLKLFEEIKIEEREFPYEGGNDLSVRERKILSDLIGETYLDVFFEIKVEDHYYYTRRNKGYNVYYYVFETFGELKDYILLGDYIRRNKSLQFLELLKTTQLDPSFDENLPIRWASGDGYTEIVRILLNDPRVDPSAAPMSSPDRSSIRVASEYGHIEIVRLLLNDPRVRDKLSDREINKYTNEIY